MPTKKSAKENRFDIQKIMDNPDSYKNLIYGIITVVVLFAVLFLGLRTLSNNQPDVTDEAADTQQEEQANTHVVEAGETLWSIAEEEYGDGFKWELIAEANNLTDASLIEEGTRLTIPPTEGGTASEPTAMTSPSVSPTAADTEAVSPTQAPTKAPVVSPTTTPRPTEAVSAEKKISGGTYKIVEGDYLWDIAVRAYGDGYRWVEIANENKIANPDLIYPGNELKLKRP